MKTKLRKIKKIKAIELVVMFLLMYEGLCSGGELFFLSRETDKRWSITPYYVNRTFRGWAGGDKIEWQWGYQGLMFQPSIENDHKLTISTYFQVLITSYKL